MTKEMGKFIVVEGMDGSGKSSIAKSLASALAGFGCPTYSTFEIGGTPIATDIRKMCFSKHESGESLSATSRLLMVTAARIQHLSTVVIPKLREGINVVCDRYVPSTAIYQGVIDGTGKEMQLLYGSPEFAGGVLQLLPDAMIFVQIDADIAFNRGVARTSVDNDQYKNKKDRNDLIHSSYMQFMKQYAQISSDSTHFVDNNGSRELLEDEIRNLAQLLIANNQARVDPTMPAK